MHYVEKNNLFIARLPGISANSNENYRRYNFQDFVDISGNFRIILISGKFTSLLMTPNHHIMYRLNMRMPYIKTSEVQFSKCLST